MRQFLCRAERQLLCPWPKIAARRRWNSRCDGSEPRRSVMMIVAHPDDEDGALLTYLSRGLGARVTLLTLNRGEGGQNAMSADAYDALGIIRTNELLKADEFYGAKQLWGTEADFGFSKTQEEAFAALGTRPRALRCSARGATGAAAGDCLYFCRRHYGWARPTPGFRRDCAGGFQGGRRPEGFSRAIERRSSALAAAGCLFDGSFCANQRRKDVRLRDGQMGSGAGSGIT